MCEPHVPVLRYGGVVMACIICSYDGTVDDKNASSKSKLNASALPAALLLLKDEYASDDDDDEGPLAEACGSEYCADPKLSTVRCVVGCWACA